MPGMGGQGGADSLAETAPRRRSVLIPTIIVLAVLVGGFVVFTGYYTDWLWYQSVDKAEVFTTSILTRLLLFGVFGAFLGLMVGVAMWIAWRTRPTFQAMTPEQASLERYRMAIDPYRRRVTIVLSVVVGFIGGLTASGEWGTYLLWRNATPFGIEDPQFGLDLSFFTFTLPFVQFLLAFGFSAVIVTLISVIIVQYLYGGLRLQPKGDGRRGRRSRRSAC